MQFASKFIQKTQSNNLIFIWCSKDGYLFDKEAILQYIITKKTEYAKKLKEYERQKRLGENEASEANALEEHKKLMKFVNTEKNVITPKGTPISPVSFNNLGWINAVIAFDRCVCVFSFVAGPSTSTSSISNMANGRDKQLPSFWLPSQAPAAKRLQVGKPDPTILCPVSQKPIKGKDLIDVKFTLVQDPDDKKSLIVKENRYMCAVTHDILSNSVPCAVLKTT